MSFSRVPQSNLLCQECQKWPNLHPRLVKSYCDASMHDPRTSDGASASTILVLIGACDVIQLRKEAFTILQPLDER